MEDNKTARQGKQVKGPPWPTSQTAVLYIVSHGAPRVIFRVKIDSCISVDNHD
jgi:hypothetical protein